MPSTHTGSDERDQVRGAWKAHVSLIRRTHSAPDIFTHSSFVILHSFIQKYFLARLGWVEEILLATENSTARDLSRKKQGKWEELKQGQQRLESRESGGT